jgi:hypothetical protein
MDPETYLDEIRAEVPCYDELQEATVDADPLPSSEGPRARRRHRRDDPATLERYPDAEVTGLDSQPEMVFKAREHGIEVRLARMEDPLPTALGPGRIGAVGPPPHPDQKRDLFRRVREQSRAIVMGDVVVAEPQVTPPRRESTFPRAPRTWRLVRRRDRLAGGRPGGHPRGLRLIDRAQGPGGIDQLLRPQGRRRPQIYKSSSGSLGANPS